MRANIERDFRNLAALEAAGWRVLVIWECEANDERALARLAREISRREPFIVGRRRYD